MNYPAKILSSLLILFLLGVSLSQISACSKAPARMQHHNIQDAQAVNVTTLPLKINIENCQHLLKKKSVRSHLKIWCQKHLKQNDQFGL